MKQGFWTKIAACALAVTLAGCAESESDSDAAASRTIGFGVATESRAVINSAADMTQFHVWAYHYGGNDAETMVFDPQEVNKSDGQWVYEPLQQWEEGVSYNFYALYPAGSIKNVGLTKDETGMSYLEIFPYDASPTGTGEIMDLMLAAAEGVEYDATQGAQPVALTFYHLLARVKFVGKAHEASAGIPGFNPVVYSAKLYGMYEDGSFSGKNFTAGDVASIRNGWTIPATGGVGGESPTTADEPYAAMEGEVRLTTDGEDILNDMTVIPQSLTQDFYVEITYSTDGGATRRTQRVQLISLPLTTWEAGQAYAYTFTVSDNDRILFDTPTVTPWDEASGGIIIVD